MKKMVSGLKPSGNLTLGNYIGAIKNFIEMQHEYEMFIFIADMHAITVEQDPGELKKNIRSFVALYLACGLDPSKVTLFLQSENVYHANLGWILECNSYMGELNRMTQFKEKKEKNIRCGLFTYPVLMASDILIYDADYVPVGSDQKQHVELTRNIAERFNNHYGHTFTVPEPVIPKVGARIMSLQDPISKMGKSDANPKGNIYLLEDINSIKKKIMSSVTDSESIVKFDMENKPGISNLITIYNSLTGRDAEVEFKDSNYGTFKTAVFEAVRDVIVPLQEKYNEIIGSDIIDKVLDDGNKKVFPIAKAKLELVKEKVGLTRKE